MASLLSCKNCVYCSSNCINASVFQQLCDYLEAIIHYRPLSSEHLLVSNIGSVRSWYPGTVAEYWYSLCTNVNTPFLMDPR